MYRIYAPTTEDIDNFHFEATTRLVDLLRGEIDLDAISKAPTICRLTSNCRTLRFTPSSNSKPY